MKKESAMLKTFVDFCEYDFEERMNHVCRKILRREGLEIITLSGPTCSGKTTLAKKLISNLGEKGKRARCISIDDYFYDRSLCDDSEDFDSVKALDLDTFSENIDKIGKKEVFNAPVFDFKTGSRSGYVSIDPKDYDVFLFEGIQAIYPEVAELIKDYEHASIFISVSEDPVINGVKFDRREIRFLRRLVRDYRFRAADAARTFEIWEESVLPNENANIIPNTKYADIKINSYMPYELFILKKSADAILSELPKDSVYREAADALSAKISGFDILSEDYIPEISLYREFIGEKQG